MSPTTTTSRRLTQESLTEQRFPEDFDYDDITVGRTFFKACRRRADHSEGEGPSSCLSSSSMSHDRTVKPVVCRDASHAQGHEIQRQNSENEQIWTLLKSVQNRHSRILLQDLLRGRVWKMHREPEVLEAEAQVEECLDCRARITLTELATIHSVKNGILQNACSARPKKDADLVKSDLMRIARLKNSLARGPKRMVTKVQWLCWKITRQLGCVFQDMTPPKSILRKCTDMRRPIQRVKFTKAIARHTDIRDQNPSLGFICPGEPHQRSPNAPKFEDRSQEETEWQEQGAREAAWKLAKSVLKLKEKNRATFFSPSENRCLPASILKPEEREFVVDSGASMHMISKKDLSDAETDTLTKSCSPTIVITANGEVQTHEEATVYVKELDIFLTMKVLENTPAVLSLGKLCDENGLWMDQWSKTTSH